MMTHHPHTNRLTRHLLFWGCIVLFHGLNKVVDPQFRLSNLLFSLADLFLADLPIYLVYSYLLAYGLLPLAFRGQFGWFISGLLLLYLASWFIHDVLVYMGHYPLTHWFHQQRPAHYANTWFFNSKFPGGVFIETNLTGGLFVCLKLFREWRQKQMESQRLEREKLRQDLNLLKLQLNPGLLFGSLATLHHHVCHEPQQAPAIVLNLAHFLRYVLYESRASEVPLAHETESLEQYVCLQRAIRPDLSISFSARGVVDSQLIAPVLLLPLVEWAFESVQRPYPSEPAWVSVDLLVNEMQLTLKVIHSHANDPTSSAPALTNSHKQLDALYGGAYSLQTSAQSEANLLVLHLPVTINQTIPLAKKRANRA